MIFVSNLIVECLLSDIYVCYFDNIKFGEKLKLDNIMKSDATLLGSAFEKMSRMKGDSQELLTLKKFRENQFGNKTKKEDKVTESEIKAVKEFFDTSDGFSREYDFTGIISESTLDSMLGELDKKVDSKTDLLPIKGISKVMQARLRSKLHISDAATLHYRGKTIAGRSKIAKAIDANVTEVDSWVKQANLWQLEGITADMAYLLVLIGVRHISDLSKVDAAKAAPHMNSLSKTLTDFTFNEGLLKSLISSAKDFVNCSGTLSVDDYKKEFNLSTAAFLKGIRHTDKKISTKDFDIFKSTLERLIEKNTKKIGNGTAEIETSDDAPVYLFADDCDVDNSELGNENSKIVVDGLKLLINTVETLPFPSVVRGCLCCDSDHCDGGCSYVRNAMVEISGIVSSSEDDVLDKALSTYTDSNGNFIICLPSTYSLKEYIKITVTKDGKQQTFIKSKYEFLKSMPCYEVFNLSDDDFIKRVVRLEESNEPLDLSQYDVDQLRKKYVDSLTSEERTAELGILCLLEDIFEEKVATTTESGNALPSVRLMGSEADDFDLESQNKVINLNCDTAPVESFSYSMLQRLIAPKLSYQKSDGTYVTKDRSNIGQPIDIDGLKDSMIKNTSEYPVASTLGMGYVLNMHQGWVPDGFSLGSLLYSLILAPGEEQKLIVRENTQTYMITDTATGEDDDKETYSRSDSSDVQVVYDYGAQLTSDANSSYDFTSKTSSFGGGISGAGGQAGMWGLAGSFSGASSKSKGNGSSSASQTNTQDEASYAAQTFQNNIRTASEKLSKSSRVSMSIATDTQSDSVATKIIANHNHSHAMTIQYWEVMRNYKLATNIDSVDLVLYVPLKPIQFLPAGQNLVYSGIKSTAEAGTSNKDVFFDKIELTKRYPVVLKHASSLLSGLPYKYRTGLNLIQQFAAAPNWKMESMEGSSKQLGFSMKGYFLENDEITINLVLKNGKGTIQGNVVYPKLTLPNIFTTKTQLQKAISEIWKGNPEYVKTLIAERRNAILNTFVSGWDEKEKKVRFHANGIYDYFHFDTTEACRAFYGFFRGEKMNLGSWDESEGVAKNGVPSKQDLSCTFDLGEDVLYDDISHVEIVYTRKPLDYTLYQGFSQMNEFQIKACVEMYNEQYYYSRNNKDNYNELKNIAHYQSLLPESFKTSNVSLSTYSLNSLDKTKVSDMIFGSNDSDSDTLNTDEVSIPRIVYSLGSGRTNLSVKSACKTLRHSDFQKMEETFHYIVSNGIKFSQNIWSGMTENERVMLLEQFNLSLSDTDFKTLNSEGKEGNVEMPLLNCINVKKVLGYYGNCMLFPFTFPEELSEQLGMTAADLQNRIYRYHVNGFKAPTTRISIPTKGMVGEAVLGESNVSEKIDITRFWNWQDSPISSMELNNNYLNSEDYLENKKTMEIKALNLASAEAATPITGTDYISALAAKNPTDFDNITGLEQLKDVLNAGTTSASSGLSSVVTANKDMTNQAMTSLTETQKTQIQADAKKQETAASLLTSLFGGSTAKSTTAKAADGAKADGAKAEGDKKNDGTKPTETSTPSTPASSSNGSAVFSQIFSGLGETAQVNLLSSLFGAAIGGDPLSLDTSKEEDLKNQIKELEEKIKTLENAQADKK